MAIVNLDDFKRYVGSQQLADEPLLELAIATAESWVQNYCRRDFTVADPDAPTTRIFPGTTSAYLDLPDFIAVDSVTVDDVALDATGFEPYSDGPMRPFIGLRALGGLRPWSTWFDAAYPVSVSAAWGWPAVPAAAKMATLVVAKDILANRDVSFGIVGFTDYAGVRAKENPQVAMLLADLQRFNAAAMIA